MDLTELFCDVYDFTKNQNNRLKQVIYDQNKNNYFRHNKLSNNEIYNYF